MEIEVAASQRVEVVEPVAVEPEEGVEQRGLGTYRRIAIRVGEKFRPIDVRVEFAIGIPECEAVGESAGGGGDLEIVARVERCRRGIERGRESLVLAGARTGGWRVHLTSEPSSR